MRQVEPRIAGKTFRETPEEHPERHNPFAAKLAKLIARSGAVEDSHHEGGVRVELGYRLGRRYDRHAIDDASMQCRVVVRKCGYLQPRISGMCACYFSEVASTEDNHPFRGSGDGVIHPMLSRLRALLRAGGGQSFAQEIARQVRL